eukprot:6961815-Prymnesium_polylepis.1
MEARLIPSGYVDRASSTAPAANGTCEIAKHSVSTEGSARRSTTPKPRHATMKAAKSSVPAS